MSRVVLHVDRLLLRGFARGDAAPLSAGLRAELQSLLKSEDAVAALSQREASHIVKAGTVRVPHGGSAHAVGRAVATRIVRGGKP
jgi:hypothetical protein